MNKYTYDEIFQRNIGLLTRKEQQKINNLSILIVGCGGIGGWVAEMLARLGVGELILADPEDFEVSNLNRQAISNIENLGKNKARAVGNYLKKINPYLKIEIVGKGINKKNIPKLLNKTDFVIDTIDFYSIEEDILLHKFARELGKNVFLSQVAGSKATFTNFSPNNKPLDYYLTNNNKIDMLKTIKFFFPELPKETGKFLLSSIIKGKRSAIPSISIKPIITASIVVEDVLDYVLRNKFYSVPFIGIYDFDNRTYKRKKFNVE
ncbi:MAG: ThiF family adenylyltransferase [Patescibacteria group bacterium]|nr:ThiF family adenylyltransferase [Patescibacteria group bacterium]